MSDDLRLNDETSPLIREEQIEEQPVRNKPNLLIFKVAGYAIPLAVVAYAIFGVFCGNFLN